jgi:hypothetical protein
MKTFLDWAKETNFDMNVVTEVPTSEDPIEEKTKRAGISDNYPDAYALKKLYPPSYFTPITSTATGKLTGKIGS